MSIRMMYRSIVRSDLWLASIKAVAQFDERLREARNENAARENGEHALADALKLQHSTQQRILAPGSKRGRRRKGQVIDLDNRTVVRSGRRRWLMALLVVEALVAAVAVAVFVIYLLTHSI